MSLMRRCDRCQETHYVERDEIPEGWIRLEQSERPFIENGPQHTRRRELCGLCKSAFWSFLDAKAAIRALEEKNLGLFQQSEGQEK